MRTARRFLLPVLTIALGPSLIAQRPQGFGGPANETIRQGVQLDLEGKGAEARAIFQKAIDTASTPATKANAQRAMAMSWAFEGNCNKTAEYEELVIAYWKTQEQSSPADAFYQQGEMADEAARVCLDSGDLETAYKLYQRGHDLGLSEPNISPARRDLWNFRWENAQARIAARRGNKAEADQHIRAAQAILDEMKESDAKLYEQQAHFIPALTGYVAFYNGDYRTAVTDLEQANQNDPAIQCLIGMAYEKLGNQSGAQEAYRKALNARAHNPPAAFGVPLARKKIKAE